MSTPFTLSLLAVPTIVAIFSNTVLQMATKPPGQRAAQAKAAPLKSDCSPSPAKVKVLANELAKQYRDPAEFTRALDVAVGINPDTPILERALTVYYSSDLAIVLMPPYEGYRGSAEAAIRKREPISSALYPVGMAIHVSPTTLDAPDVEKIIVERDGVEVRQLGNLLLPTTMTTRMGAKTMIHSGFVVFACSAFAPGADVVITAIPKTGHNIEKRLSVEELQRLR